MKRKGEFTIATQSILESAASRAQEDDGADPQTGKAGTKIIPTARFKKNAGDSAICAPASGVFSAVFL